MSREHLYKAKRVNWTELLKEEWWIEGLPSYDINGNITEFEVYKGFANCETIEIEPDTLCEYTGLTDKNGTKIFEGDVLKQKTTKFFKKYNTMEWVQYGVVRFGEYDFTLGVGGGRTMCFYLEHLKSESIFPKNYCVGKIYAGLNQDDILEKFYPYEVIGNVFDNPEFLKGDDVK